MTKSGFDRIVLPIVTIVSLTSFDSYAKTKQLPLFSPNALEVVNHEEPGISPESDSDGMEIKTEIAGSQVSIRKESKAGAEFLTIQVNQHQVSWKNGFSNYSYPYPRMPTEVHVYSPEEQIFESNSDELLIALGKRRHKKNNQQLVQTIDQYPTLKSSSIETSMLVR